MEGDKKFIKYFYDLDVYQRLFSLSKVVIKKVIPKLPLEEKFDLVQQMRRASKAATAMIAEGFPKRFQAKHWDKYLVDAIGECEEMINHLMYVRDLYAEYVKKESIELLIEQYKYAINQLHLLNKSWKNYHRK